MKKHLFPILLTVTLLFAVFTLGFFLGRNYNHETIHLSELPSKAMHDLPPEEYTVSETRTDDVSFPVNINTAGLDELTALPGIGETLAQRILDFRNEHGNFTRPEELMNVEGIGAGKLEALLDYVVTGG